MSKDKATDTWRTPVRSHAAVRTLARENNEEKEKWKMNSSDSNVPSILKEEKSRKLKIDKTPT